MEGKKHLILISGLRTSLICLGIFLPLFFWEIYIRLSYELPVIQYSDTPWFSKDGNGTYIRFWEEIDFKYARWDYHISVEKETKERNNETILSNKDVWRDNYNVVFDASKNNTAFIWDSVTYGWAWGMINNRFSYILNNELSPQWYRFFNFAESGVGISWVFIEYEKYVKNYPINTVIYTYTNGEIYPYRTINGKMYSTPVIVETTQSSQDNHTSLTQNKQIDDILLSSFILKFFMGKYTNYRETLGIKRIIDPKNPQYHKYLIKRFSQYIKALEEETQKKGQRFIVIISPSVYFKKNPPLPWAYEMIYEEDQIVSSILQKNGIESYNLYNLGIQDRDYFVDDCCHLNKAWHKYYADFIKTLITWK